MSQTKMYYIRQIQRLEDKFDIDYLERWNLKDLKNYARSLKFKANKEKRNVSQSKDQRA